MLACNIISMIIRSKLGFSRILDSRYGTFWRCSRVRLLLCQKWTDLDQIWNTL